MKKVFRAFLPFASEIAHNYMLAACIIGPVFMGAVFRFAIPFLETFLCEYFNLPQILAPYYILFDLMLVIMTPILFCFAGVLVILEELDCDVARYYSVTPLGKSGYLLSRMGIPTMIALIYDFVLISIFTVSGLRLGMIVLLSVCGTLTAVLTSLLVVSFAHNKMEGMALVKLCGLLIVGIPVAYFVLSPVRYLFGIFPSFWMAELCRTQKIIYFIPALLTSLLIIFGLYQVFKKKLL